MRKCNLRVETQRVVRNPSNLSYALLFFFMLVCNILTPYLADDFTYMFSFQSGERIRNLLDIFPSMLAHAQKNERTAGDAFSCATDVSIPGKNF